MDVEGDQNDDWNIKEDFQEEIREIQENEGGWFTELHDEVNKDLGKMVPLSDVRSYSAGEVRLIYSTILRFLRLKFSKKFPELTVHMTPGFGMVKLGEIKHPLSAGVNEGKNTEVEQESYDTEKINQNNLFSVLNKKNQLSTGFLVKAMDGECDSNKQLAILKDLMKHFSKINASVHQYGLLTDLKTVTFAKYDKTEDKFSAQRTPFSVKLETDNHIKRTYFCEDSKTIYLLITCMILRQIKELRLID